MKNLLKHFIVLLISGCFFSAAVAQVKAPYKTTIKLMGKSESGVKIYKRSSKTIKQPIYYGMKNGKMYTAKECPPPGPIGPGTTTPIPSNCEISCLKSMDGKSQICYLICPAKKA